MSMTTHVPVTIQTDAGRHIDALGMRTELDQLIVRMGELVPEMIAVRVRLDPPYDTGDRPRTRIEAVSTAPFHAWGPAEHAWREWMISAFPPAVCVEFQMFVREDASE